MTLSFAPVGTRFANVLISTIRLGIVAAFVELIAGLIGIIACSVEIIAESAEIKAASVVIIAASVEIIAASVKTIAARVETKTASVRVWPSLLLHLFLGKLCKRLGQTRTEAVSVAPHAALVFTARALGFNGSD